MFAVCSPNVLKWDRQKMIHLVRFPGNGVALAHIFWQPLRKDAIQLQKEIIMPRYWRALKIVFGFAIMLVFALAGNLEADNRSLFTG
jgi:hypothetical protein